MVIRGTADSNGALWLITYAGPGKLENALTQISPAGDLIDNYRPTMPLKPGEWVSNLTPAANRQGVGLLASIASGGKDLTFEGAFFLPIEATGLGAAVRVSGPGPQFPDMIGFGISEFIAAGDQAPLTLLKLSSQGSVLWRRSFSRRLVLPTVSASESGNLFVLSQAGDHLDLRVLDSIGRLLLSKSIAAKQGVVEANAGGGCTILCSIGNAGRNNKVFLLTLDRQLRTVHRVETTLVGWGGRTYRMIATPHGELIAGEGPEPNYRNPRTVLAEFDRSGRRIWQQTIATQWTPLLAAFPSGFYIVRESFPGEGMDVEKYSW